MSPSKKPDKKADKKAETQASAAGAGPVGPSLKERAKARAKTMATVGAGVIVTMGAVGVFLMYPTWSGAKKETAQSAHSGPAGEKAAHDSKHSGSSEKTGNRKVAARDSHAPVHHDGRGSRASESDSESHGVMDEALGVLLKQAKSVQNKVYVVGSALEENQMLKLENANLRLWSEALRFDCTKMDSSQQTQQKSYRLSKSTGSKIGRTLASINYSPPAHLLPTQLYTLGVSYFKAEENEKAAVIFTFLTSLEENEAFKTGRNYLLTAVSWYRLDHYSMADQYLDKIISLDRNRRNESYQAQARLWKAVISKRKRKHRKSQHWMIDLVDNHPFSTEASWINPVHSYRKPAQGAQGSGSGSGH